MSVFLPVAGITIRIWILIGAGGLVGFLSGLLGVGGGFLLTPILIMAGIPPTVAAASDSCQIVAASSSAVAAHFRLGNVDFKMGFTLLAGGLTGAALGVQVIKALRALGNADLLITVTYILVLGAVGGGMFLSSLRNLRRGPMAVKARRPSPGGELLKRLPFQVYYPRSGVRHSIVVPFLLCVLVGVLSSIMGVGGGFMMVPMMVYLLRMPAHVAVGTDLFQILFTCAGITYMQSTANHTVDLVLALLLAAGSTIGAQIGARLTRFLRGDQLLIILAVLALLVTLKMTIGVLTPPSTLLTPAAHAGVVVPGGKIGRPPGGSMNGMKPGLPGELLDRAVISGPPRNHEVAALDHMNLDVMIFAVVVRDTRPVAQDILIAQLQADTGGHYGQIDERADGELSAAAGIGKSMQQSLSVRGLGRAITRLRVI